MITTKFDKKGRVVSRTVYGEVAEFNFDDIVISDINTTLPNNELIDEIKKHLRSSNIKFENVFVNDDGDIEIHRRKTRKFPDGSRDFRDYNYINRKNYHNGKNKMYFDFTGFDDEDEED